MRRKTVSSGIPDTRATRAVMVDSLFTLPFPAITLCSMGIYYSTLFFFLPLWMCSSKSTNIRSASIVFYKVNPPGQIPLVFR